VPAKVGLRLQYNLQTYKILQKETYTRKKNHFLFVRASMATPSTNEFGAFASFEVNPMVCGSGIVASFSIPADDGEVGQAAEATPTLTPDLIQKVESQEVEPSQEVEKGEARNVEPSAALNVESEEIKNKSLKDESAQPKLSKKVLARIARRTEKTTSKAVLCPVEDALSAHRAKHPVVIDSAPSGYKQEENGAYYKETPDEMDTTRIFKEASNLRADVERLIASDKASTDRYNADAAEGNKRSYVTKEGLRNCFGIPRERDPYLYLKMKMPVIFDLLVDPKPQTDIERYMELLRVMCHEKELVKTGKKNKHLADATVEAHAHRIYNTKPTNLR
jgi:hypothetical protein